MELVPLALSQVFYHLGPEMILGVVEGILFLGGTWKSCGELWTAVALLGLVGAGSCGRTCAGLDPQRPLTSVNIYGAALVFDAITVLVSWLSLGGGIILVPLSWHEVPEAQAADFPACLLLIVAGTSLTAAANDL